MQATLSEVDPSSVDDWIRDFEKDQNPERELRVWEAMTDAYQSYCSANTAISIGARQEVLKVLLVRSGTDDEAEVLAHVSLNILTPLEARDVMKRYKGDVAPIEVERK